MIPKLPKQGESWEDRLEALEYTSPKGSKIQAYYERTSQESEARGTVWDYPGVDGAYVQRTGTGAREYPLTMIFSGEDCDYRADQFEAALREPGYAKLQTPLYGKKTVVPLGKIVRTDNLTDEMNKSTVAVTLWETLTELYPGQKTDALANVKVKLALFNVEAAKSFNRKLKVDTVPRKLRAINSLKNALKKIKGAVGKLASLTAAAQRAVALTNALINSTLSDLIGTPLFLAGQMLALIQAPGALFGNILAKLEGYKNLIASMLGLDTSKGKKSRIPQESENDFAINGMVAAGAVSGMVLSAATAAEDPAGGFTSREDAIETAIEIERQYETVREWTETRGTELDIIEDADAYDALRALVDAATLLLVESSFSLPTQRVTILDRDRGLIELCAELYGATDHATLDLFTRSNKLKPNEILQLPKGRGVITYV